MTNSFNPTYGSIKREKQLQQKIKQAEREGGQILITKSNKAQGAAGLSALPPGAKGSSPDYTTKPKSESDTNQFQSHIWFD